MVSSRQTLCLAVLLLSTVIGVSCSSSIPQTTIEGFSRTPWPYHRGGPEATGSVASAAFSGTLTQLWERKQSGKPAGPLTIYGDLLFYPSTKNKIRTFDTKTGRPVSKWKSHSAAQTGVVVLDERAYAVTAPHKSWLRCYAVRSGNQLWRTSVTDAASGSLIIDSLLVVAYTDGRLVAHSLADGEPVWTFRSEGSLVAPPSYGRGRLIQPANDGRLFVLSPADGALLRTVEVKAPLVSAAAVSDYVYAADMTGRVHCIDPETGDFVWQSDLSWPIWTAPAVAGDRVVVGHSGGEVVALDALSGAILWQFDTDAVVRASPTIAGSSVIVGTMTGDLFSLRLADGSLIEKRELGRAIACAPVTDGERVYVATDGGLIVCYGGRADNSIAAD